MHKFAEEEALAQQLIRENGTTCQILRRTAATGPDHNPLPGATTSEDCLAVLVNYKLREIDGTLIKTSDRKALVSTDGVSSVPTVRDQFQIGTDTYQVVNVSTISPADVAVMWNLQLRGA